MCAAQQRQDIRQIDDNGNIGEKRQGPQQPNEDRTFYGYARQLHHFFVEHIFYFLSSRIAITHSKGTWNNFPAECKKFTGSIERRVQGKECRAEGSRHEAAGIGERAGTGKIAQALRRIRDIRGIRGIRSGARIAGGRDRRMIYLLRAKIVGKLAFRQQA